MKDFDQRLIVVKEITDTQLRGECISLTGPNHCVEYWRSGYLESIGKSINGDPLFCRPGHGERPRSSIDYDAHWGG